MQTHIRRRKHGVWSGSTLFADPTILDTSIDIVNRTCYITKTCLYDFDPLKPHFYIVKLGFTGVYIIFLISAEKHRLCTRRGGSNEYPQSMFWAEIRKISDFLSKNLYFLVVKFSVYLNRRVFVMVFFVAVVVVLFLVTFLLLLFYVVFKKWLSDF